MPARFSSTLRSVARSAWLRIPASALAPPAAEYTCSPALPSLWRITSSTCWMTRVLASPMRAMRSAIAGWSCSGMWESTSAASPAGRLASTSATVCADSPRSSVATRSAGTRRRNSNGLARAAGGHAPEHLGGALGAQGAFDDLPGELDSPADSAGGSAGTGRDLAEYRLCRVGTDRTQPRHLAGQALDLLLAHPGEHVRGALGPERGHQDRRLAGACDRFGKGGVQLTRRGGQRGQRGLRERLPCHRC